MNAAQEKPEPTPPGKHYITVKFSKYQMDLLEKVAERSGRHSVAIVAEIFENYAEQWCERERLKKN